MLKQTIQYTSPIDALVAIAKRLSTYENQQGLTSEEFFYQYQNGQLSDDEIFIDWSNDYQHYLAIRTDLEKNFSMLHEHLANYLKTVEQAITNCEDIHVERYIEELLSSDRVNLRIRIRFSQGHLLAINEAVKVADNQLVWLDYRYHCQNCLHFRYDCTPHFPKLPTCPHHKHLPHDVVASEKPNLVQVIQEAYSIM